MLHPKSRRSLRKQRSLFSQSKVVLVITLAAVALLSVQFSTSSVSSKSSNSMSASSGRLNARVAPKHRAASASTSYSPLPLLAIDVDRTDDTALAVTCTAAPNDCSLRGAVAFANLLPGTTINVPAGTYTLNIPGGFLEGFNGDNSIGDLDILGNNTSIVGAGASVTTIQQTTANDRVIEANPFLDAGFNTSISGVTLTGGKEHSAVGGGAIISGAINNSLTLSNCVISGNTATGLGSFGGGGVAHTGGSLTVTNCTFSGNSTSSSGGGISYSAGDPLGRTPSTGTLNVSGSTFSGNSSSSVAAGGGALDLYNFNRGDSTYNVSSSSFTSNTANNGNGGAIVVESGPLTVGTSSFFDNAAGSRGGAIMSAGTTSIQYSRLFSNSAPTANGRAIYAQGSVTAGSNWWGINSGPSANDIAGPGETATTIWLQLRLAANPTTVCSGASSTLTADILQPNVGSPLTTELNGLPNFTAQFFNGVPAFGTISSPTNFVNGVATATYTAGASSGSETVQVSGDAEVASTTIAVQANTTSDPANQEVCEGGTATFTTTTSGPGSTTYVWKQGTTVLNNGDLGGRVSIVSGSNTSTLTITNVQAGDAGTYTVDADSECNDASQSATLTVNTTPDVTLDPVSQTVTPGNSVTFTAAADGSPAPTVQWQVSVNNGPFTDIGGATSTSYTFTAQASDNGNRYRAVFTNTCGSDTSAIATLTTCNAPDVTGSPASVPDACEGSTVNFSASATGDPTPSVQWEVSTDGGGTWSNVPGATSTTLSVNVTTSLDGNQYRAVFTNDCGSDTSAAATLGVDVAPNVTSDPASIADACAGSTVSFSSSATGDPAPSVQWQVSTNGGGAWADIVGATSTTYSFTATSADNGKQFRAVFTNHCGSDTSAAATLTVDSSAPVITLNGNTITLWPPNHNYQTVSITDVVDSVSDSCGGVTINDVVITSVSSDEPENGEDDGTTTNDIVIAADCKSVQLRAERQASGNGRVYRVNLKVTDGAGNVGTATAKIYVPTIQNGGTTVDNGPAAGYTVNSGCP